jgi:hypothetical protein
MVNVNTPYFVKPNVNNAGLDPIQGYDIEVWIQYDDETPSRVGDFTALIGRFQTLTLSVRDATETYLELGHRLPTYLNGEIQIAWVLEQGLIDMAFLQRTFGVGGMSRSDLLDRSPRFSISFDVNAHGLRDGNFTTIGNPYDPVSTIRRNNPRTSAGLERESQGRIELRRCKVDSISMGAMAGRRVAALRWEGVAEGWEFYASSQPDAQFLASPTNPVTPA